MRKIRMKQEIEKTYANKSKGATKDGREICNRI